MPWGTPGRWAVVLAALVGLVAGVTVALQTTAGAKDPGAADPGGPGPSRSASGAPENDPLGVGVPLVNLDCTGKTILVVGWDDATSGIANAVSSNNNVRYLETAESCPTLYQHDTDEPTPTYVAYMGPFDTLSEPCSLRMSVDHKGDSVTSLKQGLEAHVQCLCVLDPTTFPVLNVGMTADTRAGIYIRSLQQVLVDLGQNPTDHVTGIYDEKTADMIEPLQKLNALDSRLYRVVEINTWRALRDRACINYDF